MSNSRALNNHLIHGILFHPSAETVERYEETINSAKLSVKSDFLDAYNEHIAGLQIVAMSAKIYILKNYKLVADWSDLCVIIKDRNNAGFTIEYFNYVPRPKFNKGKSKSGIIEKIFDDIERKDKKKHNPIISLTECVLDPSDGDFSLTINGKDHIAINDDSVIIIAAYIEEYLKEKQK